MNDQDVTVTINFEDPVLASGYRSWVGVMAAFHDFTFENLQGNSSKHRDPDGMRLCRTKRAKPWAKALRTLSPI